MTPLAITRTAESGRYVWGWASVTSRDGEPVTDAEGDRLDIETLRKAAHAYVAGQRLAKRDHAGAPVGEVVESLVVDDDVAKALGIADDRRGWLIGMRIDDPAVRERVAKGELRAFSIGGRGRRAPVRKSEADPGKVVVRQLINTVDVVAWAISQGFEAVTHPADMHVTVIYSPRPYDAWGAGSGPTYVQATGGPRTVETLGNKRAVVLRFEDAEVRAGHARQVAAGGEHAHPEFLPHVTLTYRPGALRLEQVQPYTGTLVFGPEQVRRIDRKLSAREIVLRPHGASAHA